MLLHIYAMWIDRKINRVLLRMAKMFPAVLIAGPRQAGKTALLRHTFPHAAYVSLDNPAVADAARTAPDSFLSGFRRPVIIDEIQYVPSLFRHLKVVIDADQCPGQFLLTGSQSFPLMQGVSESLAGRCGLIRLNTLSHEEIRAVAPDIEPVRCVHRGGYPALYAGTDMDGELWYPSYVATYVERDIRNMLNVQDLTVFNRLVRACAVRTAQTLNYTDLARDVAIAPNTARQWVSLLVASGLITLADSFHANRGKRLIKAPKVHISDTGLGCHLAGIVSETMLMGSAMFGAFWESFVVGQVVRAIADTGLSIPVHHWRTAVGQEVDIVLEIGDSLIAFECKAGEHPDADDARGIRAFRQSQGSSRVHFAGIVSRSPADYLLPDGTEVLGVGSLPEKLRELLGGDCGT